MDGSPLPDKLEINTFGRLIPHEVATAKVHSRVLLPGSPAAEELGRQGGEFDAKIVGMQRTVAKPRPYRFVIKPHEPPAKTDKR